MKPTRLVLIPLAWAACGLAQPLAPPAGWQQSQQRDPADTYTFTRFTLLGRFLNPPPTESADRPALRVECIPTSTQHRSKFLGADLLVGTALKILYVEPEEIRGTNYFPEVAVRYRTDGAKQDEQKWQAGTDRIPTAKPSDKTSATIPRETLKKMLHAQSVAITVDSDRGAPLEMQFDMPSAAAVEAACRVE